MGLYKTSLADQIAAEREDTIRAGFLKWKFLSTGGYGGEVVEKTKDAARISAQARLDATPASDVGGLESLEQVPW